MLRVMRRRWEAVLLVALTAAGYVMLVRMRRERSRSDLRDAVGAAPYLSRRHASLARDGRSACRYCHSEKSAVSSIHALWGGVGWANNDPAVPDTAVCLSCHDGTLASVTSVHGPQSHPIGIDYALARQMSPGRFNDVSVGSNVRLDDGRIGCLSCHSIHRAPSPSEREGIVEASCQACHSL